mgnify:FL=1
MTYNTKDFIELKLPFKRMLENESIIINKNKLRISTKLGKKFKQYAYYKILFDPQKKLILLKFSSSQMDNSYKITWQGNTGLSSASVLSKQNIVDPTRRYIFKPIEYKEDSLLIDISNPTKVE